MKCPTIEHLLNKQKDEFHIMKKHSIFGLMYIADKIMLTSSKTYRMHNTTSSVIFHTTKFSDLAKLSKTCGLKFEPLEKIFIFSIEDEYTFEFFTLLPKYCNKNDRYLPAEDPELSLESLRKKTLSWFKLCWLGVVD